MAKIVGGIATSHSPTIGFALDAGKQKDPVWAPIFAGYEPVQKWLAEKKPDVLFYIYNDHVTSFFFDHYSHFALGIGDSYSRPMKAAGPRKIPPIRGHRGAVASYCAGAGERRVRPVVLPGQAARSRLFFAALTDDAARAGLAGADHSIAGGRAAVPDSFGAALLQAGPVAAAGDPELSRRSEGRHRRFRRHVAPGARRARRIQQRAVGSAIPGHDREGPGTADAR